MARSDGEADRGRSKERNGGADASAEDARADVPSVPPANANAAPDKRSAPPLKAEAMQPTIPPPPVAGPWRSYKEIVASLSGRIVEAQKPNRVLNSLKWEADVLEKFRQSRYRENPQIDAKWYDSIDLGFDPKQKAKEFEDICRNIDRELPASSVGPLARVLTDFGKLPLLPAEIIDHSRPLASDIKPEVSVQYGKYLSTACQGCHRENMKGGEPIAPGFPVVADISSSGNPGKWTAEEFIQALRTGHTPEGKALNPQEMPWTMTKAYTDVELKALHVYLQSI